MPLVWTLDWRSCILYRVLSLNYTVGSEAEGLVYVPRSRRLTRPLSCMPLSLHCLGISTTPPLPCIFPQLPFDVNVVNLLHHIVFADVHLLEQSLRLVLQSSLSCLNILRFTQAWNPNIQFNLALVLLLLTGTLSWLCDGPFSLNTAGQFHVNVTATALFLDKIESRTLHFFVLKRELRFIGIALEYSSRLRDESRLNLGWLQRLPTIGADIAAAGFPLLEFFGLLD